MKNIKTHTLKESSKEFYGIINNTCPMCDMRLDIAPTSTVTLGTIGYCLSCYLKFSKHTFIY